MRINPQCLALTCGVCVVVLACDASEGGPVAPVGSNAISWVVNPALTTVAPSSIAGRTAGGHADIRGTTVQGFIDETYSFTALSTGAFPLAKGQVQVDFLLAGERFTVHAEVTCVSIVDNQAWVGSRVRRYVIDGQEQPGRVGGPMVFRVQDIGEGYGATDLASFVFFGFGNDLAYCSTRPEFPILHESTNGNIQVKGG